MGKDPWPVVIKVFVVGINSRQRCRVPGTKQSAAALNHSRNGSGATSKSRTKNLRTCARRKTVKSLSGCSRVGRQLPKVRLVDAGKCMLEGSRAEHQILNFSH